ncbi:MULTISPECIES: hypothetical protein [unclassified Mesorhizobium]|uniref:hypothetical protein n=1 Tax=unclassified Mesorhizobium TaxID=325217 RepID=UPI0032AEB509
MIRSEPDNSRPQDRDGPGVYNLGLIVMALYVMLHRNPPLEPIVATGTMIVAVSALIFAFVVFSAETARSVSGIPAVPR